MIANCRLSLGAIVASLLVWIWLVGGLAPELWAQGVPSNERDIVETPASTETVGGDTALGKLEEGLVESEPSNNAFYQPSLHYPSDLIMNSESRMQRVAWVWSIIVVVILAAVTWPLNEVEALCMERELRVASRQKQRRFALVSVSRPEGVLDVVERQVGRASEDDKAMSLESAGVPPVTGRNVDSVPLMRQLRRWGGVNADNRQLKQGKCDRGGSQSAVASGIPEFMPSPMANPLSRFSWPRATRRTYLPFSSQSVPPGLYVIVCASSPRLAIHKMVLDLLQREQGCVAVATADFDPAQIAFALAGVEESERAQRLQALRRNSRLLNKSLRRLLFPKGERLYTAEFLRQLERGSHTQGVAAVVLDLAERYEIGALPRVLPVTEWLAELNMIATHGNFPVFLVVASASYSAAWPYPSYRWTEVREDFGHRSQVVSLSESSAPDNAERG